MEGEVMKEPVNVFMGEHHICVARKGEIIYVCKVLNRVKQTVMAYLKHNNYQPSLVSTLNFPWLKEGEVK